MATIVQKYGGSSLSDLDAITRVSRRIAATAAAGHQLVVVVSAMGDTTDELLDLCHQLTAAPDPREQDLLLATGEITTMTLLAINLNAAGIAAKSFTGGQAGIITNELHGHARIVEVRPEPIRCALAAGKVVLVAGFQGVAEGSGELTTLGRGGSDTTAVALAAALDAEVCEIYTDVAGVFTADPRLVPDAGKLGWLCYDDMLELAAHGCQVLLDRCVEYARNCQVVIHVRSSFSDGPGTWISERRGTGAELSPFSRTICGIAQNAGLARVTVQAGNDVGGESIALLVQTMAEAGLPIDRLETGTSDPNSGQLELSMLMAAGDAPRAIAALTAAQHRLGFGAIACDDKIGSVAVIGRGMRADPVAVFEFVQAVESAGAHAGSLFVSDTAISATTDAAALPAVVRNLHACFGLDRLPTGLAGGLSVIEEISAVLAGGS
jgi:aspartate kinase